MLRTPTGSPLKPKIIIKESVLTTAAMEQDQVTLSSDDEQAVAKIDKLSNDIDMNKSCGDNDNDVLAIVKQIRASQCTKDDLVAVNKTFNEKFGNVKKELNAHKSRINTMEERFFSVESKLDALDLTMSSQNNFNPKITSQSMAFLDCHEENENFSKLAILAFKAFGCKFTSSNFKAIYRSKARSAKLSSIIVHEFDNKLKVLNAKLSEPVSVGEGCATEARSSEKNNLCKQPCHSIFR